MSLAVAPQQWNARSLLHPLFWEVHSPSCSSAGLAGILSDGRVDPGGMEEEHQGRETEREGDYSTERLSGLARPRAQFRYL